MCSALQRSATQKRAAGRVRVLVSLSPAEVVKALVTGAAGGEANQVADGGQPCGQAQRAGGAAQRDAAAHRWRRAAHRPAAFPARQVRLLRPCSPKNAQPIINGGRQKTSFCVCLALCSSSALMGRTACKVFQATPAASACILPREDAMLCSVHLCSAETYERVVDAIFSMPCDLMCQNEIPGTPSAQQVPIKTASTAHKSNSQRNFRKGIRRSVVALLQALTGSEV
jgi:hypothetical protein